jgi:glutamate-1-semialdehyde 2,1-aminomutase
MKAHILGKGQALYNRARQIIPGGGQLLSKRPEMFLPDHWPAYYSRAKGAHVWDLDDNVYADFTHCGVGTCVLGFADPDVTDAATGAMQAGAMSTLNAPEEVELAEVLLELHPWAEMVRFGRTGGEAVAGAVRIARAATGRDLVAICGYHGWHDWYLAANLDNGSELNAQALPGLEPLGVPDGLSGTALPFQYNRLDELEAISASHGKNVAAIIMEPVRNLEPSREFLEGVRKTANRIGAVLIFDEITSGFRMTCGGHHLVLGIQPDVAIFGKAMGNGHPIAAIIGRRNVMQAAQKTFVSSTYWTERVGPAAAIATIKKFKKMGVSRHLVDTGTRVQDGWRDISIAAGIDITVSGIPPLAHFRFNEENSTVLETLFTQEMLSRGYLASSQVYAMLAHDEKLVGEYLATAGEVFSLLADALKAGNATDRLIGPVRHTGFNRLN